jgi:hypothetical protein
MSSSVTRTDNDDVAAINSKSIDDTKKKEQRLQRIRAEFDLVGEFISIFGKHHKQIVQQRRQAEDMMQQVAQPQQLQQTGATTTNALSREEFNNTFATIITTTRNNDTPKLTETEQRILSRTYYQNWHAGFMAGVTTFGILMGFSHWSARRMVARRGGGLLPPPPKKSYTQGIDHMHSHPPHYNKKPSTTTTTSKNSQSIHPRDLNKKAEQQQRQQQQSWAMDPSRILASSSSLWKNIFQKKATTATTTSSNSSNKMATTGADATDDIMPQIQIMVFGGMAIVATILTSWATIDKKQYYHELAKLPLAPGKSYLCHAACPEVVEKYYSNQSMTSRMTTTTTSTTTSAAAARDGTKRPDGGGADQAQVATIDAATILKDPMTEEAEAMARLVVNCQQRMQYEKDHQENGGGNNDANGNVVVNIVDVPEPGVPSNYSGISVRVAAAIP